MQQKWSEQRIAPIGFRGIPDAQTRADDFPAASICCSADKRRYVSAVKLLPSPPWRAARFIRTCRASGANDEDRGDSGGSFSKRSSVTP